MINVSHDTNQLLHRHYYFVIGSFAFYDAKKEIAKIM